MMSFITDLSLREKLLYGAGLILSLIILAAGIILMVSAFGGESSPSEEEQRTTSSEENGSDSQPTEENRAATDTVQSQNASTTVFTPSQVLSYGVQSFRVVGEQLLYISKDSNLRKTSFSSGKNEVLQNLDLDSPQYIYIPPQKNPDFIIVKNNGRYRTITFGKNKQTFQLPEDITYISVEPVSETIYAVITPQNGMTNVTKMSLEGKNKQNILSRRGLDKVQFAGNNLFYSTPNAMYEYSLSENKERTILSDQSDRPRFTMQRQYFVGVITAGDTSYLYGFSETPRELKTLDITIPAHQVVWSNQKREFFHIKGQTIRTFTWQDDQIRRNQVNLEGMRIAYPFISTDPKGQIIFLGKENNGVYRLVTGRI